MSRFSAKGMKRHRVEPEEPDVTEYTKFGGKFQCQTCTEVVRGGFYDTENWTLWWVCSEGHRSRMEDFVV